MDAQFWHDRWRDNLIAFHKQGANPFLERFFDRLGIGDGGHVLVPLCGKSVDMRWLREHGCTVTGVELSEIAVRDFFREQGITARECEEGAFRILKGNDIELLAGDFFALDGARLGRVSAVYDRAALVALPAGMRVRYVEHLLSLLAPEVPILLLTFEYPAEEMDGPPFSVDEAQVRELFAGHRLVTRLESVDRYQSETALVQRGLSQLVEHAFLLSAL